MKHATNWVFESTKGVYAWLEDEHIAYLLVRSMRPKPGLRAPRSGIVTFQWGDVGGEDGTITPYLVRAEGVTRWALTGEWDADAVLPLSLDAPERAPVVLHQLVPGRLELECARVVVTRGRTRPYQRPFAAPDDSLLVFGPREVTWRQQLAWIGPPPEMKLFEQMFGGRGNRPVAATEMDAVIRSPFIAMHRLQERAEDERPWLWIQWSLTITTTGHYVSLRRGTMSDEDWARVTRVPAHLGACTVMSGTVRCSGEEWMARWAK